MRSEKLVSADNQQESLSREERRSWFLAGFVEGEGSVCVCLKRHPTAAFGYYVQPEFLLYQHRCRRTLLEMAQEYFACGTIVPKPGNEDVLVYSIKSRQQLEERVVPFLEDYMEHSARRADYCKFAVVVDMLRAGIHRDRSGLIRIVRIAYSMNMGGKHRRVPRQAILDRILRGHTPDASKGK